MVDGQHGGGDEPGRADERADSDLDGDEEQVQVVTAAFLQHVTSHTHVISTHDSVIVRVHV